MTEAGGDGPEGPGAGPVRRPDRTVLVTGATGLIGSHAARLFHDRGWRVRALARPGSDVRFLEGLGATVVLGDVTEPSTLSGAAEGCRAVVHAAAFLGGAAPWERFREVNVEGTRHVLSEAVRAGCRRFVHVSSVAAYGDPVHLPRPVDEEVGLEAPLGPRDHYERSKRMAEAAIEKAGEGLISWSVLRPALVTGERDRHLAPRVAELADRKLLFTVGRGDNPLPLVYAGDVAEACRRAATRPEADGRVYNVVDAGSITQRQFLRDASPGRPTMLPLPRRAVESLARATDRLAALAPDGPSRVWTARRVGFLGRPNPFSADRIRRELGWRPEVGAREGWRRALRWLGRDVEG